MRTPAFVLIVLAGFLGTVASSSCSSRDYTGQTESLTVAWSPFEQETLLWIADDQNIFVRNGLDVTLRKYDTGAGSMDGMLNGEADITVGVTEFPTVRKAFEKSRIRVLGTVAKIEQLFLVGRKDRGIESASDLRGKRIGTTLRTIAEFYLGRFLERNGMSLHDITVVDLRTPAEWENAVADGVVDAIVTAQPYADLASQRLGSNTTVWPAQGGQYIYGLIVSSEEWVTQRSGVTRRFLESLAQAEEYAIRNPAGAKAIMQERLNVDAAFVESAWSRDQFGLSLDKSLLTAMEDEARWMIANNLTEEKQVPNFLDFIYEDALKAIQPEAVNITR